ncbi:MAG: PaaI family thioesterase [Gammaproteobacteria bacterium]|nr:PaaI family thioesterase [Gammaproteobacteria bacterium]
MNATAPSIEQLNVLLQDPPFQKLFDFSCTRLSRDPAELEILMRYTPSVERAEGTRQYHGGAIASLIDIAGDYALWVVLGYGVPTINFRVDYLRPASATDLRAIARVRRAGRTVAVVDIDVLDDQARLVAVGRGTYGTREG